MNLAGFDLSFGRLLTGVFTGLTYGLLAVGLVLVYRASRFINFASAAVGVFGASVLGLLVAKGGLPYWLAFPLAVIAGGLISGGIELGFVRRISNAPRVLGTVVTLGLSKALILKPDLLVVDEFSLGLAPVVVGELLAMVRQLNAEGTAVLLVEQSVNVALNLVDRCYFMEKGRVVYEGRSEALRARPDLVQALSLGGLPHEIEEHTV